jgi:hypothetical protein
MPDKGKWPFDSGDHSEAKAEHDRATEHDQARLAAEVFHKQHLRHDRFLEGGRAHTRKRGLS